MTDFETAARKAAEAAFDVIRHIIAEHPDLFEKTNETHWAARDVLEIEITKHYADLAETFGLLCELVRATMGFSLCAEVGNLIKMKEFSDDITRILSNPRIAALLKKGAFDKGAENG